MSDKIYTSCARAKYKNGSCKNKNFTNFKICRKCREIERLRQRERCNIINPQKETDTDAIYPSCSKEYGNRVACKRKNNTNFKFCLYHRIQAREIQRINHNRLTTYKE